MLLLQKMRGLGSQAVYCRHLERTHCERTSRQSRIAPRQPRRWLKKLLRPRKANSSSRPSSQRGDRAGRRRFQNQAHHQGHQLFLGDLRVRQHHLDLHHSDPCLLLPTKPLSSCVVGMEAELVKVVRGQSQAHLQTRRSAIPG